MVELAFESRIDAVASSQLEADALAILNRTGGWGDAGFAFAANPNSGLTVVLAEGDVVDALCLPLETYGTVSCQNGAIVALNATRWRGATETWDGSIADYRHYLINHEIGHLIGLRHPTSRCPVPGAPAAVMEQQTAGLEGCQGNGVPRPWEIEIAKQRPATIGPLPDWQPPRPANQEGQP